MKIATFNKKGGVGKTPISYSLARDLNYYLVSNDDSVIETAYPDMSIIVENDNDLKLIDDTCYDFGGFVDSGILKIIEGCDIVIVPVDNTRGSLLKKMNSLKRTLSTLNDIEDIAKKIFVVATKTKSLKDFYEVQRVVDEHHKSEKIEYFNLPESSIFDHIFINGCSILDMPKIDKRFKNNEAIKFYKKLLKRIRDEEKN